MSVDVRPEVTIRRPRTEVAAFMFDPGNDLRWTGGITASRPARPGPLVAGRDGRARRALPRPQLHLRLRRHRAPSRTPSSS